MSEVMIDASKIKVEVSNMGPITFVSDNGKICIIHMHPYDTGQLVKFLVKEGGYDFSGKDILVKNDKIDATNYEDDVYCIVCGATYSTPHKPGCRFYAECGEFEIR